MAQFGRLLEWMGFAVSLVALALFIMLLRGANALPWMLVAWALLLVGSAMSFVARRRRR